jgi:hypothetical protein
MTSRAPRTIALFGSHGAIWRNPSGRNETGTEPPEIALPVNTKASAASAVPGRPTSAWQAATNSTNDTAPRKPIPTSAAPLPVRVPRIASITSVPPSPASRAKNTAPATRHHSRKRAPTMNRPTLPITLGISSPSSNTNAPSPARSPWVRGATSTLVSLAPEAVAAAVSVLTMVWDSSVPCAPALSTVSAPVSDTTSAPAVD